jgi:hypothetical protein
MFTPSLAGAWKSLALLFVRAYFKHSAGATSFDIPLLLWDNQCRYFEAGVIVLEDYCSAFQKTASEYLVRHRSIIDALTKYQESCSRVNRAIAKAVTTCGCVKISADKQCIPSSLRIEDFKSTVSTHLDGDMCEQCQEILTTELGNNMFYVAALCELLGLKLHEVFRKEEERLSALGYFKMR